MMDINGLATIVKNARRVAREAVTGGRAVGVTEWPEHKSEFERITAALIQAAATNEEWKDVLLNPKKGGK